MMIAAKTARSGPSRPKKGKKRPSQFVYSGAIKPNREAVGDALYRFPLFYSSATAMSSSATGVIQFSVPIFDPTLALDYANMQNTFREFRVVGAELRYFPNDRYSKTTVACRPLTGVVNVGDSTLLTGYNQAWAFDSAKVLSLEDPWRLVYRLPKNDAKYGEYEPTGPASTKVGVLQVYSQGLTNSTNYGTVFMTWLVECRGRK
jgi:hypothetical protein